MVPLTAVVLSGGVRLPVFAGAPADDVDDWAESARAALAAAGLTDKTSAARALVTALAGAARDFVRTISEETAADPDAVFTALRNFFGPVDPTAAARAKLFSFRRGDLSVPQYAARVLALCRRVRPDMPEAEQVDFFIRGLDALTMQALLGLPTPSSLADAISVARRIDHARSAAATVSTAAASLAATFASSSSPDSDLDVPVVAVAAVPTPLSRDSELSELRRRVRMLELAGPSRNAVSAPGRLPAPTASVDHQRRHMDPARDRFTTDGKPICNKCGVAGHIARACQAPRQSFA